MPKSYFYNFILCLSLICFVGSVQAAQHNKKDIEHSISSITSNRPQLIKIEVIETDYNRVVKNRITLTVLNNEHLNYSVTEKHQYQQDQSTIQTPSGVKIEKTFKRLPTGMALSIIPTIKPDNKIDLNITFSKSKIIYYNQIYYNDNHIILPSTVSYDFHDIVHLYDNQEFVIYNDKISNEKVILIPIIE